MSTSITERQQEIYDFIRDVVTERSMPPTMREIGEHFRIRSTNGVEKHLAALEKSGLIVRERGKSRGITLPGTERKNLVTIPLLGRVAAGMPVLAPENREGDITVDFSLFAMRTSDKVFALAVRGESMIEAHIMDGDTVLVKEQPTARNGDIVVAMTEGEATVKRFYREGQKVRLQPENRTMKPLMFDKGDLRIIGKVVGMLRKV
ncbi:MAG: transcriptional repressor LexA [Nitrospirota bacterium]|nr:transcriptional repressor LexA [Nitrospirota bacterium]